MMENLYGSFYQTFIFYLYSICLLMNDTEEKEFVKNSFFFFVDSYIEPKNEDFFDFLLSIEEIDSFLS